MAPQKALTAAEFQRRQLAAMREEDLAREVRRIAELIGLLRYHTYDSRRSEPGFPDEVLVGRKVLYRELKRQGQNPTAAQQKWIARLQAAGQDVAVWRPEDLRSGRILSEMRAAA